MVKKKLALVLFAIVFFMNSFLTRPLKNYIGIGPVHLDIMELFLFASVPILFLMYGWQAVRKKENYVSRLKAGLPAHGRLYFYLFSVFTLLFIISALIGFFNRNTDFFVNLRGFLFFYAAFMFFMLMIEKSTINFVLEVFNLISMIFVVLALFSFFSGTYTDILKRILGFSERFTRFDVSLSGSYGNYYLGLSAALLYAFIYNTVSALYNKKKTIDIIFASCAFMSLIIFFHKPVVVMTMFTVFVLFVFGIKRYGLKWGAISAVIMIVSAAAVFLLIPKSMKQTLADSFRYKWLNIGRTGVEDDLSTGRLTLWKEYFGAALRGFGFSPWGLGKAIEGIHNRNPHNHFVFLSYNIGLIGAVLFFIGMIKLALKGFMEGSKNKSIPLVTSVVFVVAALFLSMYSGILNATREYIVIFALSIAVMIQTWKRSEATAVRKG